MKQKFIDDEWVTVEDLIKKHERFIYKQAVKNRKEAQFIGLTIDDLFSVGSIGLMDAFEKYDSEAKVKFLSFAGKYIFGYMRREMAKTNHLVKIPILVYEAMRIIRLNELEECSPEEIAEITGIRLDTAKTAVKNLGHSISYMQDSLSDHDNETHERYFKADEEDETVFYVNNFMDHLNDNERKVLIMRMNGNTLREIGKSFGKSRSYCGVIMKDVKQKYLVYAGSDSHANSSI